MKQQYSTTNAIKVFYAMADNINLYDCTLSNASRDIDKSGRLSKYAVFQYHRLLFVR